jgi:tetratricopeptide (TPR) repeat protein
LILKPFPTFRTSSFRWLFLLCSWLFFNVLKAQSTDSIASHIKLFNSAESLQDSGKFKESIPLLKKATKEKTDYFEAWNLLAMAHMKTGKYKDALKALEKAEKIAPMNYQSLKTRGITHYLNNNFPASKNALDTALIVTLEESIEDAELHYYRAQLMFKGKGYKETLGACEAALEINPRMWEALVLQGEARFAMKEYKYAIRELSQAIDMMKAEKVDYKAYQLRAKSKFEIGDFKGAVTDWDVYLEAFPEEEEALIARAAAKININDNTGAIVDLDKAIKINGKNPVSWCYRGVAKGGNKSFEAALKDLDQSLKLKFDYAAAYVNRAAIKMALKDKRGACKDLEKADSIGSETAYKLIEQYCK